MILEHPNTEYAICRIPGIVCSERGSLLAYYECRKTRSDWAQIDLKIQKSADGGENWRQVLRIRGNGQTLNNPVMFVKDNRLYFLYCENYRRIFRIHSDDDGENWQVGEIIRVHGLVDPSECAMAMLTDGWVIMSIRNESQCRQRCFAVSPTGYSDWDGFQFDERFPDPVCQGSMAGTPRILCHLNCESTAGRKNLTLKVSRDGFATFESHLIAESGGYADLCIRDGKACVLHETNGWEDMELVFTTVEL